MSKKKDKKNKKADDNATVFIVAKSELTGKNKIKAASKNWFAIDRDTHAAEDVVEWKVLDKNKHQVSIGDPSHIFVNVSTGQNEARAQIADIEPGYYEYTITIDGNQPVQGGSAPGIIIE